MATPISLKGKTVCLTGTLSGMTRAVAQKHLVDMGATVVGSMSSRVHLLIAGEKAGSKLDYANRYGIQVWDEVKFQNAVERHSRGAAVDEFLAEMGEHVPPKPVKITPEHYGDF